MSGNRLPVFEEIGVGEALDRLSVLELALLPYGTVKLASDGRVILFSEREAVLSGFLPKQAVGQHWLISVAPCMDREAFRELLARAASGTVDEYLADLHDFRKPEQALEIRLVSGAEPGTCWLLIRRI